MPKHLVAILLGLACASPIWAQGQAPAKNRPPPFRPEVELTDVWRKEPTDFLGIIPGKQISEQAAVTECRIRIVPSTGERVLDKEYAHFCTTNAPSYSTFRNAPDLGFPYDVNFLMRKKVVEGVQITLPRARANDAFQYMLATYGPPTSVQQVKARDNAGVQHDARVYSWAGSAVFMSFTEYSPTTGRSTIALVTNDYLDARLAQKKPAR